MASNIAPNGIRRALTHPASRMDVLACADVTVIGQGD